MDAAPTVADLTAIERMIGRLAPADRRAVERVVPKRPWVPLPGPQTMAYDSPADILLFGGQAGPGKSELLVGLAVCAHEKSVIFRRQAKDLRGLEARLIQILGDAHYHRGNQVFDDGKRLIEFGHLEKPGAEFGWQGRPHDFIGFDEGAQVEETKVAFVSGWLRSTTPGQRCRIVIASNPPLSAEGEWLVSWFAPWLDETHPQPAVPGELRWRIRDAGTRFRWVDGPGEHVTDTGERVQAESLTFIPGNLDDNPFLSGTTYRKTLQNLPDVMREALLHGNFMAARRDDEWQVIPTEWVRAAQARWKPDGWRGNRMTAIGVDVAQGGGDETTLSPRYGAWYAELISRPGKETPETAEVVGLVVATMRDGAAIVVDIGGGFGVGPAQHLKENGVATVQFNGAKPTTARAAGSDLAFLNKRAEAYWRFREALDPGQEGGSPIALPPDQKLLADLCASRWKSVSRGIQIEAKEDVRQRLGRSPDRGDACVMAWAEGEALAVRKHRNAGGRPRIVLGHAKFKTGRR